MSVSVRGVVANSYTRSMEVVSTLACLPSCGLTCLICGSGETRARRPGAALVCATCEEVAPRARQG